MATLRPDHPRLVELRERYAAFGGPAVTHSRWAPEQVARGVDLTAFRGQTHFVHQYHESPRVDELKYFALLTHVEDRDPAGLLERMPEDTAFGAVTYAYPGRPLVSREVLEAVLELGFLTRHLGAEAWDGLSVLDVGAGYGRLAHRATQALPGLGRWACTDAVPEATFLSEYYLGFRGADRADVVPLDEVDALAPGTFALAVNIHSFSECPESAVAWWIDRLVRLDVPRLFLVPNESEGLRSLEPDGSRRDLLPLLDAAGFAPIAHEPLIDDPAVEAVLGFDDQLLLYAREESGHGVAARWAR